MLGRTFASDEDTPGHNVVLLSYGLWQRRYGGVSSILGETIDIDRQPYTVVGVMRQNFDFPLPGPDDNRSEEHTSELQSLRHLVCRLLLEKKNKQQKPQQEIH